MFTIAHLTDIQMPPLPSASLRELMNKRIFGYLNWHLRRKTLHRREILDALVADLQTQLIDHLAVTGDLVNISLPSEFVAARKWLEELGPPDRISVIPGNHDAYVQMPKSMSTDHWQGYMTGDGEETSRFPFVRRIGDIAIIALNSGVPTPPFSAAGALGPGEVEQLGAHLSHLGAEGCFRIVLIHHPPLESLASGRRGLADVDGLYKELRNEGAELVLYGHNHVQRTDWIDSDQGAIPVIAAPSASAAHGAAEELARYNLFRIERGDSGWQCSMTGRGLIEPHGAVTEIETVALHVDR